MAFEPANDKVEICHIPTLVPLLYPQSSTVPALHRIPPRPADLSESNPFADNKSAALDGWRVDRHVFPAAFPRSVAGSVYCSNEENIKETNTPAPSLTHSSPEEKISAEIERVIQHQNFNKRPTDFQNPDHMKYLPLWIAANRYVPLHPNKNGITLIFLHACFLVKETWEPAIAEIIARPDCPPIYDIWALDNVWHGDSAILNRDYSFNSYDWSDNGRDLLNFLLRYMPPAESESLPCELIRQPLLSNEKQDPTKPRDYRSWRGRRIVAIGNSFGGSAVIHAASSLPYLFAGIILIDPSVRYGEGALRLVRTALRKSFHSKNHFASFDLAKDYFVNQIKLPFRHDVMERYLKFGLIEAPQSPGEKCKNDDGGSSVRLKTPKKIEHAIYSEMEALKDVYRGLKFLPRDLPVHWLVPEKGSVTRGHENLLRVLQQVPHSTIVKLPRGGQLLPLDNTMETSIEIVNSLKEICPIPYIVSHPMLRAMLQLFKYTCNELYVVACSI